MSVTSIKLDSTVRDRLNAEARRDGVPVSEVLITMLEERARARRFAELGAAIAGMTGALRDGYAAESAEWDITNEDGTPDA